MYSNEEIRHHLAWMRDNTDINPYAITRTWELWERKVYKNHEVTSWIDHVLHGDEITPPWEMKKEKWNFGGIFK